MNKKLRVAQVVCTFPPYKGGIGNVANDYAQAVKNAGHESFVFTPDYDHKKEETEIKVLRLKPFFKFGNAAFVPQLFFYLVRGNFDVVHLHYPFFGGMEMVWLAKKIYGHKFKLIIHYHMNVGKLPWYLELLRLPARIIEKSLFSLAEGVTCASIDYIKNNDNNLVYKNNQAKFFELPFGVDVKRFYPTNVKKKQILFVGGMDRAHYFKGVNILISAFSELENNDYSLVLFGGGDLVEDYKKQVKDFDLENRVTFPENLSDTELIKAYQESSVLVLPSINGSEAFGKVLVEAMACGTPVIASELPGVRTVFIEGEQGYHTKPSDVIDLKSKIELIINHPELTKEMGEKGRKLVEEKYDIAKINQDLLSCYEKIV